MARPHLILLTAKLACVVFTLIAANPATAEVFKWTDADGRVHYGDRPPDDAKAKSVAAGKSTGSQAAEREVKVEDTVMQYYEVGGVSADELYRAMKSYGPVAFDGEHYAATCKWKIGWKSKFKTEGGQCTADGLQLTLSAAITFPKWTSPEAGTAGLRDKWEQMTKALRRHEDGHKENGVRAANDFAHRLRELQPQPNCAALTQEINAVLEKVYKEYRPLDQAYDRATNHGESQGATLF